MLPGQKGGYFKVNPGEISYTCGQFKIVFIDRHRNFGWITEENTVYLQSFCVPDTEMTAGGKTYHGVSFGAGGDGAYDPEYRSHDYPDIPLPCRVQIYYGADMVWDHRVEKKNRVANMYSHRDDGYDSDDSCDSLDSYGDPKRELN